MLSGGVSRQTIERMRRSAAKQAEEELRAQVHRLLGPLGLGEAADILEKVAKDYRFAADGHCGTRWPR